MPINIIEKSMFTPGYGIKYITGWDDLFKMDKYSGKLKFYPKNPQHIVSVEILADRNTLKEEDITIVIGDLHNSKDVKDIIKDNTNTIYEICRSSPSMVFALDLENMNVLTDEDFVGFSPSYGLNTLFKFENVVANHYYCLVNATKSISDDAFYAWLMSYLYSTIICLNPKNKIDDFAKQFLQAISLIASSGGMKKKIKIASKDTVLNCGLSSCGEDLFPVPGSTKRYEHLVEKSLEQYSSKKRK